MHKVVIIFPLCKPKFTFLVQKKTTQFFWSVLATTTMGFQGILKKIRIQKNGSDAVESGFLKNEYQLQTSQNTVLMRVLTQLNNRYRIRVFTEIPISIAF
jgi:hypothetical protein